MLLRALFERIGHFITSASRTNHYASDKTYGTDKYWYGLTSSDDGQEEIVECHKRAWTERGRSGWDVFDNGVNPNSEMHKGLIFIGIAFESMRLRGISLPFKDAIELLRKIEATYETEAANSPEGIQFLRKEAVPDHFSTAPTQNPPAKLRKDPGLHF